MRFLKYLYLYISFIYSFACLAQNAEQAIISGKVSNERGKGLIDAVAYLDGTNFYSSCDSLGRYTIKNIPPGEYKLVIASFGYLTHKHPLSIKSGERYNYSYRLKEDTTLLDEVVIGAKSKEEVLEESAKSVDVISTKEVKLQAGDMGEVIAQTKGVSIRRSGGLGSVARFSLNGLTDDQIRFFVDGIPLGFTAYSFGFANIPVNLVDRIELYKGVVPIVFGTDALGGAVNIVTPNFKSGLTGSTSYQTGSFGTHRISADIRYKSDSTGFFIGANGFYDYAKNNYKVKVETPNDKGKLEEVTVRRFHDAYSAKGVNLDLGLKNKSWAKEISVKLFTSSYSKEIQNNNIMTIPYGGVINKTQTSGITFIYRHTIFKNTNADFIIGYSKSTILYADTSSRIYNWFGGWQKDPRLNPGEIGKVTDQIQWEGNKFGRVNIEQIIHPNHIIRFSAAPSFITRTGDERRQTDPNGVDPLNIKQDLTNLINGLEYEANVFSKRIQNSLFAKQYIQALHSGGYFAGGIFFNKNQSSVNYGVGNGFRFFVTDRIRTKLSYEYATRLPRADEVFGDGALVLPNLDLQPERSHNGNLELSYSNKPASKSKWNVTTNGFIRAANNLITVLGSDKVFQYFNIAKANSKGIELSAQWTEPKERLAFNGNVTWIDFRNTSTVGPYKYYKGDRIPNRPYFIGNGGLVYNFNKHLIKGDHLSIFWNTRYIHSFYRGWESAGLIEFKQTIPSQLVHNAGITYKIPAQKFSGAVTAEFQNISNALVYDNFGVQKPGRAFYLKFTTQF